MTFARRWAIRVTFEVFSASNEKRGAEFPNFCMNSASGHEFPKLLFDTRAFKICYPAA
jgi:hypothetical protein